MKIKFLNSILVGLTATFLYSSAQADKICVAGNFDGDSVRAEKVLKTCEDKSSDAIFLIGDYSVRGIPGRVNWETDFPSTAIVLDKFSKTKIPVYVLSGSNDRLEDVRTITSQYENMFFLKDNVTTKISDLEVLPLNGYNNKRFMFEGAKFVNSSEWNKYLNDLNKSSGDLVSVSHISPYRDVDKIYSGRNVGDKSLEKVLSSKIIDSISSAIRESPGAFNLGKRWKINPGMNTMIINTDGKGKIKSVDSYR